jgi:hypothetical protein
VETIWHVHRPSTALSSMPSADREEPYTSHVQFPSLPRRVGIDAQCQREGQSTTIQDGVMQRVPFGDSHISPTSTDPTDPGPV